MSLRNSPTSPPEACPACGAELVVIALLVDGSNLLMRSCDGCDTRSWQLGPDRVGLDQALTEVGHSVGRRRG
jgi:hypothetical protein